MSEYTVTRAECGVWMADDANHISAARAIAEDAMRSLGMDTADFRTRDKIIMGIADRVGGMLDHVSRDPRPIGLTEAKLRA